MLVRVEFRTIINVVFRRLKDKLHAKICSRGTREANDSLRDTVCKREIYPGVPIFRMGLAALFR